MWIICELLKKGLCYFWNNGIISLSRTKQGETPESEALMKKDFSELLPEVTVKKYEHYHIVTNKQGDDELVNAYGQVVVVLGKEIR